MSDKMRWRYGDTNSVVAAVDSGTVIEVGDLLWQDVDNAKPASMVNDMALSKEAGRSVVGRKEDLQQFFADNFLGVAMQWSSSSETENIRVASTGVFEFDCAGGVFKLGDFVSPQQRAVANDEKLLSQMVKKVSNYKYAIGRVAKRVATAATSVLVDIRSTVMTGGVKGSSPRRTPSSSNSGLGSDDG